MVRDSEVEPIGYTETLIADRLWKLGVITPEPGSQPKCYLSGPMTGLPYFNFPSFEKGTELLRRAGWFVYSPRENDAEKGIEPDPEGLVIQNGVQYKELMKTDLWQVCDSDAVFVLPGWEHSTGALLETDVAHRVGVPVYSLLSGRKLDDAHAHFHHEFSSKKVEPVPILDCGPKVRFQDPVSGAEKEESEARFDLIPPDALTEVARVYGYGEGKYPRRNPLEPNYLGGYPWHLSIAALERHVQKFKAGEDIDPETSLHHLAHAAWQALTLIVFAKRALGSDDRTPIRRAA